MSVMALREAIGLREVKTVVTTVVNTLVHALAKTVVKPVPKAEHRPSHASQHQVGVGEEEEEEKAGRSKGLVTAGEREMRRQQRPGGWCHARGGAGGALETGFCCQKVENSVKLVKTVKSAVCGRPLGTGIC